MYDHAVKELVESPNLRKRLLGHGKLHQLYAIINGLTVFIAAIRSMISATMWQGYAVLIPCVIGSIFCNVFWRRVIGFGRDLAQWRADALDMDVERKLTEVVSAREVIKSKGSDALLQSPKEQQAIEFMAGYEMLEDFCSQLLHDLGSRRDALGSKEDGKVVSINMEQLISLDEHNLIQSARRCLSKVGNERLREQELVLAELWGCQLSQQLGRRQSLVEIKSPVDKDV